MSAASSPIIPVFVIFCRVGGCVMVAPGLSSDRIPVHVRLYLAGVISLALAPSLVERFSSATADPALLAQVIAVELSVGVTLGFLARLYFFALEMLSTNVALTFGLGNIFGTPILAPEPAPAFSSFVALCAVMLIFCDDLHLELIRALYFSYEAEPISDGPSVEAFLREVVRTLSQSHLLALRICSPFLLFGLVVNVALGLLARLAPQVQIYFISGPAVIFAGLFFFSLLAQDFFTGFSSNFAAWILQG